MRKLALISLSLLMILTTSCRDNSTTPDTQNPQRQNKPLGPESNATGGSDGGGGNTGESSDEQIRKAVKSSIEILGDVRFDQFYIHFIKTSIRLMSEEEASDFKTKNSKLFEIIKYIQDPRGTYFWNNVDYISEYFCEFDLACIIEDNKEAYQESLKYPSPDYFKNIKVWFEKDKFCPASDKDNADASVSSYDLDAKLCFSLFSLKRVPPKSLEKTVFGLWVHELAHMHGHPEATAKDLQEIAEEAFSFLVGEQVIRTSQIIENKVKRFRASYNKVKKSLEKYSNYRHVEEKEEATLLDFFGGKTLSRVIMFELGELHALSQELQDFLETFPDARRCTSSNKGPKYEKSFTARLKEFSELVTGIGFMVSIGDGPGSLDLAQLKVTEDSDDFFNLLDDLDDCWYFNE